MKMWRRSGATGTCHAPDLGRPRSGGIDDAPRGDRSRRGRDRCDVAVGDVDSRDLFAAPDLDAPCLRGAREPHGDAVGIGDAVTRAKRGRGHARDIEPWTERRGLFRRQPVNRDAVRPLKGDVGAKRLHALRRRQQEQVAVRPEVDGEADGILKSGEERDRFLGELDIRGVRELMPKAAGVPTGRGRAQLRLAFDQHDIGHAALRKVIRDAGAHAAAADDHYFC
jgi:hypothetical protein